MAFNWRLHLGTPRAERNRMCPLAIEEGPGKILKVTNLPQTKTNKHQNGKKRRASAEEKNKQDRTTWPCECILTFATECSTGLTG